MCYVHTASYNPPLRLKVPKFDGDPADWSTFWEIFQISVVDQTNSDRERFHHLKSYMGPTVLRTMDAYFKDATSYQECVRQLRLRYGGTERIRRSCVRRLEDMTPIGEGDFAALSRFSADLCGTVAVLRNNGLSSVLSDAELLRKVVSKLYPRLRTDWAHIVFSQQPDIMTLEDFTEYIGEVFEAESTINNLDDEERDPVSGPAPPTVQPRSGARRNQQRTVNAIQTETVAPAWRDLPVITDTPAAGRNGACPPARWEAGTGRQPAVSNSAPAGPPAAVAAVVPASAPMSATPASGGSALKRQQKQQP